MLRSLEAPLLGGASLPEGEAREVTRHSALLVVKGQSSAENLACTRQTKR
jgi:hypothetical protein